MKFKNYIAKKSIYYLFLLLFNLLISSLLLIANVPFLIIIMFNIYSYLVLTFILLLNYTILKNYFKVWDYNIKRLEHPQYLTLLNKKPFNFESAYIFEITEQVNSIVGRKLKEKNDQLANYQDYLDLWIHEVKQPLANLESLSEEYPDNIEFKTEISKIRHSLDKALFYSKKEKVNLDLKLVAVELQKLVFQVLRENRSYLINNEIKIEIDICEELKIVGDSYWLKFCLNQLIDNAVKYRAKCIEIKAEVSEEKIILEITDDGLGIPVGDLPLIFNKSYTGQNGRTVTNATGIGLYLVKEILQKQNCYITCTSLEKEYTKMKLDLIAFKE